MSIRNRKKDSTDNNRRHKGNKTETENKNKKARRKDSQHDVEPKSHELGKMWKNALIVFGICFISMICYGSSGVADISKYSNIHRKVDAPKYLHQTFQKVEHYLTSFVCAGTDGFCHSYLSAVPERRTHNTKQFIPSKDIILVLPRAQCITDLDALRDEEFIRIELLGTRHLESNKPLDSGAYLAAYLANRFQATREGKYSDSMLPFFEILPTAHSLQTSLRHPCLYSITKLELLFGKRTLALQIIKAFRDMILSEYNSFAARSIRFSKIINKLDYIVMRINVMSRSFGTGPPGSEEADYLHLPTILQVDDANMSQKEILEKELEYYKSTSGIELEKGCRAMAPILDMWDHHARPNVEWKYDNDRQSFVVAAKDKGILKGSDVIVSYGKYTDTHLYAKFGFVNGDGSGWTEGSIAVFHSIPDAGLGHQFSYKEKNKKVLLPWLANYLAFDDGYSHCIEAPSTHDDKPSTPRKRNHHRSYEFKRMKLDLLYHLSSHRQYWVFKLPPRNPDSLPKKSTDTPIMNDSVPRFNTRSTDLDVGARINKLLFTCRLITLHEDDLDGDAYRFLANALQEPKDKTVLISRDSDLLEYRALNCLSRLSLISLSQYPNSIGENLSIIRNDGYRTPEWISSHVKLGEMQSLEVLRRYALSGVTEMKNKIINDFESSVEGNKQVKRQFLEQQLEMRQNPCRSNFLV